MKGNTHRRVVGGAEKQLNMEAVNKSLPFVFPQPCRSP